MKLTKLASLALLASATFNSWAQINTTDLEEVINTSMARFDVPGMAVAVVQDDKVVFAKGFGTSNLNTNAKVNKDTLFGIASNTKAFTSAALAKLVDEGKLSWDDRVIDHLPEFRLYDSYVTREMRVRDLLSHRSGLGLGQGDLMIWPSTDKSIEDILAGLQYLKPASSFRSQYAYNNLMFVTAGEVVARVSGMSWNDYIEKNILQPLHMDNSRAGFSRIPKSNKNWAIGHIPMDGKLNPFFVNYLEDFRGAGAIASSVNDMSQWLLTQLAGGKMPSGEQLFSEKQQAQMWHPHITSMASKSAYEAYHQQFRGYGLGWSIEDYHGFKKLGHGGGILGMVSQVTLLPEKKLGIVILSNQQAFSALSAVTHEVLEDALELEDKDWVEELAKKHFASKQKAYANAKPDTPADYQPQLPNINYTGTLHDDWYGDVIIEQLDGKLRIDFTHTKRLKGTLEHYTGNTFIVKWDEKLLEADAFIRFDMGANNRVNSAKMRAVSTAVTDFSFDFRNLNLKAK
ncbi:MULTISPECIES: serine hydrolase [Pseudoalteromonas]|jgi:CubicO group peptidase (beta-lactamase class C family)|uniref:serine hydrolase n=1 Tax=Pseudoalteromonas TaxID=53246 RepID=UPI00110C0E8E|nr:MULTISPECIES: serine hydrolase [Pseudoalteromonas]MCK8097094.1 serine hydrolase [Pseudoalteromonas sp. 1CM17D]MCQ8886705.1 serine hydrolase [Pseudoalteromonas agarivorans]MDC9502721.1 serine hydrolase [Pseudoalteromonas sp. Angola-18]MDC9527389.1 serine hydrolase [Pseudoalteromonas sp. Angola-30]MDC9530420.1 serine hydrolase [Pseudoalteromonas sp. Angola-7]|tara:strand:+ start:1463 stop:3004 length:1542 start_codon:yes stop_codon:yes gene_type:complete